jgi:hypothetical protein
VIWSREWETNYSGLEMTSPRSTRVTDFDATIPSWGATGAPLIDEDRLIALVGGESDAKVVAFNKYTGAEVWRALSSDWEPATASRSPSRPAAPGS